MFGGEGGGFGARSQKKRPQTEATPRAGPAPLAAPDRRGGGGGGGGGGSGSGGGGGGGGGGGSGGGG
eukprot:scaffold110772_cov60-Phaeocystis_antarctica.AAC.1